MPLDSPTAILRFTLETAVSEEIEFLRSKLSGANLPSPVNISNIMGPVVVTGCDELALQQVRELLDDFQPSEIEVVYKETIRLSAEAEGKYIRQIGGSGNYGHCWLLVEPNARGKGIDFRNNIADSILPPQFVAAIERGVARTSQLGCLAGFPLTDIRIALIDGSYHEIDSNELAFEFAAIKAFTVCVKRASPAVLEPFMSVEIPSAPEILPEIVADISARRGRIVDVEYNTGFKIVSAVVPLAEVLRSSRYGHPDYPMRFAGYDFAIQPGDSDADGAPVFAIKPGGPKTKRESGTTGQKS